MLLRTVLISSIHSSCLENAGSFKDNSSIFYPFNKTCFANANSFQDNADPSYPFDTTCSKNASSFQENGITMTELSGVKSRLSD